MKSFRTTAGPFAERPYYRLDEIERICAEELQNGGLYPADPEAIRIDRFIEKRFSVVPSYQDLGDGVLGYTKFGKNGVEEIVIAEGLDAEGSVSAERRIRSTLAHEGGHGLLHAHLFLDSSQVSLFTESKPSVPTILCRDQTDGTQSKQYRGQWWEYQANRCIGSLLMPRPLALGVVQEFSTVRGRLNLLVLEETNRRRAVDRLSQVFQVNPVVAEIRLSELFRKEERVQEAF
jgi:hypothetical protein